MSHVDAWKGWCLLRSDVVFVVAGELSAVVPADVSCCCGVWVEMGCPGVYTLAESANDGFAMSASDSVARV